MAKKKNAKKAAKKGRKKGGGRPMSKAKAVAMDDADYERRTMAE